MVNVGVYIYIAYFDHMGIVIRLFFRNFVPCSDFWYWRKERPRAGVRKNTLVGVD